MIPGSMEEAERNDPSGGGNAFAHIAVVVMGLGFGAILAFIAALWFGLIDFRC